MYIVVKDRKGSLSISVSRTRANKWYIFRQCTDIVYLTFFKFSIKRYMSYDDIIQHNKYTELFRIYVVNRLHL